MNHFLKSRDPYNTGNAIRSWLTWPGYDTSPTKDNFAMGQDGGNYGDNHRSALVDDLSPFISVLSNTIQTLSGWPVFEATEYVSKAGIGGEQVSYIDARIDILNKYNLDSTFANIDGSPITALMSMWVEYAVRVAEGSMTPYPIFNTTFEKDYETRIYQIMLDSTRTRIRHIIAPYAAYPYVDPLATLFDFDATAGVSDKADSISVRWSCTAAYYNDPILFFQFNKLGELANPSLAKKTGMVKLEGNIVPGVPAKVALSGEAYPYISETLELEWWVTKSVYQSMVDLLKPLTTLSNPSRKKEPVGTTFKDLIITEEKK